MTTREDMIEAMTATLPSKAATRRFGINARYAKDISEIRAEYEHEMRISRRGKIGGSGKAATR